LSEYRKGLDTGRDCWSRRADESSKSAFKRVMQRYGPAPDWVATQIKDRGVMVLERLATAVWVTETA